MNPSSYIQVVIALFTIISAALGSYVGIRVALTEIKGDIKRLETLLKNVELRQDEQKDRHEDQLRRLEDRVFAK